MTGSADNKFRPIRASYQLPARQIQRYKYIRNATFHPQQNLPWLQLIALLQLQMKTGGQTPLNLQGTARIEDQLPVSIDISLYLSTATKSRQITDLDITA